MKEFSFKDIDFKKVMVRIQYEKDKMEKKEWIKKREKAGISDQVSSNVFAGGQQPSIEFIVKFASVTGKPIEYYLYGEEVFVEINRSNYVEIPLIKDFLDDGFNVIYMKNTKSCVYNYKWLKIIANDPHSLLCMRVHGDSMSPFIMNGDCVKIDTNRKNLSDGSLYAFHFHGSYQITIRRIAADLNKIEIIPENPKYKTHTVKTDEINVIGQIILLKRLYIMVSENF